MPITSFIEPKSAVDSVRRLWYVISMLLSSRPCGVMSAPSVPSRAMIAW